LTAVQITFKNIRPVFIIGGIFLLDEEGETYEKDKHKQ
jgi:hypothetical protein